MRASFYSPIGNYQKINIKYPKNVTIEFTSDKIIIKSIGLLDIEYYIISKSIEHNVEIYQLNHNAKIIHVRNFPTYNNGYIELVFADEISKKCDTINFIYNKNK